MLGKMALRTTFIVLVCVSISFQSLVSTRFHKSAELDEVRSAQEKHSCFDERIISDSLSAVWKRIDRIVEDHPKTPVSGGIFLYHRQQVLLTMLVRQLAMSMMEAYDRPLRVCETGFGAGHSAALFLEASQHVVVLSFDRFERPYQKRAREALVDVYGQRFHWIEGDSCETVPVFLSSAWDSKEEKPPLLEDRGNWRWQCDILHGSSLCRKDNIDLVENSPAGSLLTSTAMGSVTDRSVYFGSNAQWRQLVRNGCIADTVCFQDEEKILQRKYVFNRGVNTSVRHSFCVALVTGKCDVNPHGRPTHLADLSASLQLKELCREHQLNLTSVLPHVKSQNVSHTLPHEHA